MGDILLGELCAPSALSTHLLSMSYCVRRILSPTAPIQASRIDACSVAAFMAGKRSLGWRRSVGFVTNVPMHSGGFSVDAHDWIPRCIKRKWPVNALVCDFRQRSGNERFCWPCVGRLHKAASISPLPMQLTHAPANMFLATPIN